MARIREPLASFAPLARALPTGLFENEAIHEYLARAFSEEGRSNDFRRLAQRLYLVATELDSGATVTFGRAGHDHVPISKAIVPFDGRTGKAGDVPHLAEQGLPIVLSQTFRAVIDSRLAVGLSRYRTEYRGAEVVLFEPERGDGEVFFANPFGYRARARICDHAYQSTRRSLLARGRALAPILAKHGIRLRRER